MDRLTEIQAEIRDASESMDAIDSTFNPKKYHLQEKIKLLQDEYQTLRNFLETMGFLNKR
jgi:predicted nuclease with TOPRIM domain